MDRKDYDMLLVNFTHTNLAIENERIASVYKEKKIELVNAFTGAVAHLGTYLNKFDYTLDFIFSFEDEQEKLLEKLENNEYACIGVSTTHCTDFSTVEKIVSFIREHKKEAKIVVGGPFIVSRVKQFSMGELQFLFRKCKADIYLNVYHGSEVTYRIIKALKEHEDLNSVPNIFFKNGKKFIKTEEIAVDETLENCKIDWALFKDQLSSIVPIRTAISCPFACTYCAFPAQEGKYQLRSIEDIEEELNTLRDIGKTKIIHFIDDTLNVPTQRFKEILKMMKRNNYKFRWHSFFRCQYADHEMLQLMKETGCDAVMLGFESGNQGMLDRMNKKTQLADIVKGHALIKEYGITTIGYFFIGFPGETIDSVKETIRFIEEVAPDYYYVRPWYFDLTTAIVNDIGKYEITGSNYQWSHSTMTCETAERICLEIPHIVKNSVYQNITSTYIFDMINRGLQLDEIKSIVRDLNDKELKKIDGEMILV